MALLICVLSVHEGIHTLVSRQEAFASLLADFIKAAGIRKVNPSSRSCHTAHSQIKHASRLLMACRLYSSAAWLLVSQAVTAPCRPGCSTCAQTQQPSRPHKIAGKNCRYHFSLPVNLPEQ